MIKSPFARQDLALGVCAAIVCGLVGFLGSPVAALAVVVGWLTLFIRHTARRQAERADEVAARADEVAARADWAEAHFYRQLERLLALYFGGVQNTSAPLPPFGGWAIAPDFAVLLTSAVIRRLRERQEGRVTLVELGSGVSTLICGYLAMKHGGVRVLSIEHQAEYAARMRGELELHGLSSYVEIVHAPLTTVLVEDTERTWYDPAFVDRLPPIDFLIVDGPPAASDPKARYPALPMLLSHCAPGAVIVVDDATRDRQVIEAWQARYPSLEGSSVEAEKGAYVLRVPEAMGTAAAWPVAVSPRG